MSLPRRRFIGLAAAGAAATVAGGWAASADGPTVYAGETVISGHTIIRGTWDIAGLTIPAGAVLEFDPTASVTLRSTGSVVVRGTLRMRPDTAAQKHRLQFVNVDENAFLGGTVGGPDTDVGLWFYDMGMLDACGTDRAGWNRTGADPSWLPGDEILVSPSAAADYQTFAPFTPGSVVPSYKGQKTEVFNLTRNVIIGGTPGHRTHVMFMMAMAPQMICHVRIEHVGPRQPDPDDPTRKTLAVLGRYGLHFHKCGEGSRGTVVEGAVVTNCGSRAFVPHASHGITFRDCLSYVVSGRAYWWDEDDKTTNHTNQTNDVFYDRCAAFKTGVGSGPERMGEDKLTAFHLGAGTGNRIYGCTVAGMYQNGQPQTSAYYWPEKANQDPNVWDMRDCVAHNNEVLGFFAWQNDPDFLRNHQILNCVAWRNGESGIDHGAYINNYHYIGATLLGNGNPKKTQKSCQLRIHPGLQDSFTDMTLDADGRATNCVLVEFHQSPIDTNPPVRVENVSMTGHTVKAVRYSGDGYPGQIDWVRCTVNGADLAPSDFTLELVDAAEVIRVQRRDGTAYRLYPNGTVQTIPSFA